MVAQEGYPGGAHADEGSNAIRRALATPSFVEQTIKGAGAILSRDKNGNLRTVGEPGIEGEDMYGGEETQEGGQ